MNLVRAVDTKLKTKQRTSMAAMVNQTTHHVKPWRPILVGRNKIDVVGNKEMEARSLHKALPEGINPRRKGNDRSEQFISTQFAKDFHSYCLLRIRPCPL